MAEEHAKRVAVIGAGISGVVSAAHLLKQGLKVTLFERSAVAGGVWHFDERSALEPSYPNLTPSRGDYEPRSELASLTPPPEEEMGDKQQEKDIEITHAPPGPCYAGLQNNISTRLMQTSLQAWPEGTPDFVSHKVLEEYIQTIADVHGVSAITQYNTRVEEVRKLGSGSGSGRGRGKDIGTEWLVRTTTLQKSKSPAASGSASHLLERRWTFDAVVVASGHYHTPRVPNIRGLSEWKQAWPSRVWHSKGYRNPQVFKDQNVLLIGAGVSAMDIAKEAAPYAKHIYQSAHGGGHDLPTTLLPNNATRVSEVEEFRLNSSQNVDSSSASEPITGTIVLRDRKELADIHSVVLCTGYMTSYPFLSHLHADTMSALSAARADKFLLVNSDGKAVHNLYKDIFYIEDSSLAFVGVPHHVATFSLFDFQAQVVARVLAGKALLPAKSQMRKVYRNRIWNKGPLRDFQSLGGPGQEQAYVADLVRWMNRSAAKLGVEDEMHGHTAEWLEVDVDRQESLKLSNSHKRSSAVAFCGLQPWHVKKSRA